MYAQSCINYLLSNYSLNQNEEKEFHKFTELFKNKSVFLPSYQCCFWLLLLAKFLKQYLCPLCIAYSFLCFI